MDPPELPGFYYDRERKKYFKIQPTHRLPLGAKYSTDAVKREQAENNKRKREEEHEIRVRTQTVKRSSVLPHPGAWNIKLELYGLKADPNARAKALASGFEADTFVDPKVQWASHVSRDLGVRCFDYDAETRTLITGVEDKHHLLLSTFVDPNLSSRRITPKWHQRDFQALTSTVSSVHITPHRRVVVTTRGSSSPAEIQISSLRFQESVLDRVYMDSTVNLTPNSHTTIFASAPNPFSSGPEIIAVGTLGSGLKSTMCLYDLRMIKDHKATRPVFRFQDYENSYTEASGFDVHQLSGLVAAAQENGYVQLYSLKNGSKIRRMRAPGLYGSGYDPRSRSRVSCLRFVEEVIGADKGRTKLLGSINSQVVQFA
ncbi:wd40 repeat-like-containing domain [Neofusicoccum parvum]|uniref:Wd40 repeat-like-containing domain n=1 Tax=Neofusicoccum parvum TaxID=310453 RepID=A0ACB5SGE3_9PEZI|nr:wd40 repeat-like-containing domain [Neofusicoccum parvum]GME56557.1 wd40 repeat-like-containing domain [Neofusicoccum parvum]